MVLGTITELKSSPSYLSSLEMAGVNTSPFVRCKELFNNAHKMQLQQHLHFEN